jgi:O-antigen ligase
VAHYKFDNLVAATYKMEDISTMERLYRWVAGFQMFQERPITGFGPSNFYSNYKDYSVSSFQTYVSDNPEKSGIHNNYLMVLVEQGIPGLLIMLLLAFVPLLIGEKTYHLLKNTGAKHLLMAAILSFLAIDIFIIINDLLEADKIGPFFFLNAAIITYFGIEVKKHNSKDKLEKT